MKRHHLMLTASTMILLGAAGAASADCREELAQLSGGISKDGSIAPLESSTAGPTATTGDAAVTEPADDAAAGADAGHDAAAGADAGHDAAAGADAGEDAAAAGDAGGDAAGSAEEGEAIAKDGSTEPLGTDATLATSGQDAQAQQQGGETAAAQAGSTDGGDSSARDDALARAQAALDAGDEEGCMAAVNEAKG